jgi:selenocysteine-specific elongation factor
MPLTVGTAGHVDHGKTWLVRALTGKDTDRLPEEHERGISIDLGYAPLALPDGRRLSLIDVPGHERFVRNMVAGATGIDLFLLVIDAAEGARPQTHEHLAILRLLGVERSVVAVTKADAVDEETLEAALDEARELVPDAEVVAVSAKTGAGLDDLRAALGRAAASAGHDDPLGATRLWIDRSFSLRGAGTIVTGTLWSGSVAPGDVLRAEPAGRDVRVRSVQVHDEAVERAESGQRVAVNLSGVERDELGRGKVLVTPGHYPVTYRLDVTLDELAEIPPAAKVHLGTADVPARIVRSGPYAQLRLQRPVVAARGDRFVLRTETTVGGGSVLDAAPPRKLDPQRLELLERGDPESIVRSLVHAPVSAESLERRGLLPPADLARGLAAVEQSGDWYFSPEWLEETRAGVRASLEARAKKSPLDPGLPVAELLPSEPWAPAIVPLLALERRGSKAYLPGAAPALGDRAGAAAELESALAAAGYDPVKVEDAQLAAFLESEGRLVRLGDGLAVGTDAYKRAREVVVAECAASGRITLARLRDLLGTGRRSAQLLLERFDADGLTRRVGDERVLRRAALRE